MQSHSHHNHTEVINMESVKPPAGVKDRNGRIGIPSGGPTAAYDIDNTSFAIRRSMHLFLIHNIINRLGWHGFAVKTFALLCGLLSAVQTDPLQCLAFALPIAALCVYDTFFMWKSRQLAVSYEHARTDLMGASFQILPLPKERFYPIDPKTVTWGKAARNITFALFYPPMLGFVLLMSFLKHIA